MPVGNILVLLVALGWAVDWLRDASGLLGGLLVLGMMFWVIRGYWRLGKIANRLLRGDRK